MSCYIVLTEQIDAILTEALKYPEYSSVKYSNVDAIGQMLTEGNYKGVNYRYREHHETPKYDYKPYKKQLSTIAVIKLVDNLMYQSCDHPDWKESDAFPWCERIKNALTSNLPGYDEAEWGL